MREPSSVIRNVYNSKCDIRTWFYVETRLYYKFHGSVTTMCEFIDYELKNNKRIRNKIGEEEWEAEPELEKVQEEQDQQPIPVTVN